MWVVQNNADMAIGRLVRRRLMALRAATCTVSAAEVSDKYAKYLRAAMTPDHPEQVAAEAEYWATLP